ncbi:MAG TPA: metallophosphoesterase family protein [Thermoanaerobaculia bacterium]|nr:metallophosphoesterase family protein [Thermoanaerobaculia bacterium]HUM30459.1 metallophosphoesterase family protein [Thermoanaerobaculia bacterium]HXK68674.1 metallophosphoesterase family protein [Thermoanaerobaculia bacterium]
MRYLILSDIHSNIPALNAVLESTRRHYYNRTLILGDLVGYGADCNEVVTAVRLLKGKKQSVRGNHDKVAAGLEHGAYFNITALSAIAWTRRALSAENLTFLKAVPRGPASVSKELLICHGSPMDEDEYLFTDYDAYRVFQAFPQRIILFGHTHIPMVFNLSSEGISITFPRESTFRLKLDPHSRYLINPGSVGQPRDRNPMAAFAILDDKRNSLMIQRVAYPIATAQKSIRDAGLPDVLARRLEEGA